MDRFKVHGSQFKIKKAVGFQNLEPLPIRRRYGY